MKRVTIFSLHLNYGGAEKAISSLANMLIDDYEVEIISLYKYNEKPAFEINSKVEVKYLLENHATKTEWFDSIKKLNIIKFVKESWKNFIILFFKRKQKIIKAIRECRSDIIISTRISINEKVSKYGSNQALKIAWEHNHHNDEEKYVSRLINSCKNIDYLIPVSQNLMEFYSNKMKEEKCKVIYIPLCIDFIPDKESKLDNNKLISIGRLSPEKGYLDLIDVIHLLKQKKLNISLDIIGDGIEKNIIKEKIKKLKLEDNINLLGFQDKNYINDKLFNSSLYIMTSLSESFGLVILESFSYGVPAILFDTAKGPLEIVDNNIDGIIIENRNKEEMANTIIRLLDNRDELKKLGKNTIKKVRKYSFKKVKKEWLEFLNQNRKEV